MEPRGTRAERLGVVVLSRDPALGAHLTDRGVPGVDIARVASAYEAGAEILAGPVAAIVIDFRALGSAHQRLLDVARQMNVEVFGLGTPPPGMGADGLSGVRLMSRADLPAALADLAAEAAEAAGPKEAGQPEAVASEPPEPEAPKPARKKATRRKKAAKRAARPKAKRSAKAKAVAKAPPRQTPAEPTDAPGRSEAPKAPSDLLTPDELAALLEDQP